MTRRVLFIIVFFILVRMTGTAQEEFYHPELEWRTIETEHFYVHYHDGTERTARVIAKVAEEIYEPVTSLYNHKPDQKVSFIVKDYDDYSNGAAYFYDNKIEIWASSLDFDLRGTHNWLRNVVTHEFTHIVQIQTSMKFGRRVPGFYLQWLGYESERRTDVLYGYPNVIVSYPISGFVVPSWFAEGVAQYNRRELGYDSWDSHRDMILRMYALDDNMLTWAEMAVFGKTSLGNESSYNAGFAFVRYMADTYGEEKVVDISRNLSSLTEITIDGAIKRAIGKDGEQVYNEWRSSLRSDYATRTEQVKNNLHLGDIIANVGFGNFYPTFSPDGKTIAYISNKESDYFGVSGIYLYDVATKTEKLLKDGVHSTISWSQDGKKIYYSKATRDNPHWSKVFDLYVYDIENDEEIKLTRALRANAPAVSPDGSLITYVSGHDGTLNVFTIKSDGSNPQQLTHYTNGEQVYNPKWSPDGKTILFDYSLKDGRDIAMIPADGGDVQFILSEFYDERNAIFSSDGSSIIYASDETGIFNLYRFNPNTKQKEQLTNVLGGAFMPTVNASGQIAFASYASTGYKISFLERSEPIPTPAGYVNVSSGTAPVSPLASSSQSFTQFDWKQLRNYDDTILPSDTSRPYKSIATSLTVVPFLRVDNYNPKNKGIDVIKPGVYLFSYDVLDKYGFFAGAALNRKFERDLFFIFDFRAKIPGLFQLGLEPALSLEAYNLTRKTEDAIELPRDTIPVDISYNLMEFDVALKQKIFLENLDCEIRYAHSRYTATIGSFTLLELSPPNNLIPATDVLYLIGNELSTTFTYEGIGLSRTMDVNPVGRRVRLRYGYEFNKFDPTNSVSNQGELVQIYKNIRFHKLDVRWREHYRLPGWKHTLSATIRGGTIFGPPVDDFFDFYIGGLAGMKGYPFYSLGGNEYALVNLTYRFPLIEHIDVRVAHLYFDKLYAAVYGDAGTTWTGGELSSQKFKRDVGAELRLEAFSWYAYPTRIFFNATYGLDQFSRYVSNTGTTITYGKEWQFHFGILFGFDLD
jgi:Tol biopolymer transport system component